MAPKDVNVVVPPLSDEDTQRLCRLLKCSEAELDGRLSACATAALTELIEMFLGRKVFSRGSDFREYRLRLLLEELPGDVDLLDESRVSALFQSTATQSRTLIRSTLAKYQFDLEESLLTAARTAIDGAEKVEGSSLRRFRASRNVVEELRGRLLRIAREDGKEYGQIATAEKAAWTYEIGETALDRLKTDLGP